MDIYDIWLARAPISLKKKLELYKEFKSSENLWYYIFNNCNNKYMNDIIINKLKAGWNECELQAVNNIIERCGIKTVKINDSLYPVMLSNIEDAPFILFYKGNIENLNKNISVAIVGSRHATVYGKNVTSFISKILSCNGVNVVSGFAKGIDTYAHKSSIENNGFTCAVLGCGIDIIYPKENSFLYSELCNAGCIISEFIPGTQPLPYNFPLRNRIISGLSKMVIVVEAGVKSGSLITAGAASVQGRDVMAVPGSIFSDESVGTNKLIKDGAFPFTCEEDLFDLLGIDYIKEKTMSFTDKQKEILHIIKDTPVHIDDIIKLTNIDIKQLYELLFELQLKNEILCLAGNYYVRSCDKIVD